MRPSLSAYPLTDQAYMREGLNAFANGLDIADNPYPKGGHENMLWLAGWWRARYPVIT